MKLSKLPNNLSMILLGIWFIIEGLIQILSISFSGLGVIMAIFAIVVGALIILQR